MTTTIDQTIVQATIEEDGISVALEQQQVLVEIASSGVQGPSGVGAIPFQVIADAEDALTLDFTVYTNYRVTLTENCVITVSNLPNGQRCGIEVHASQVYTLSLVGVDGYLEGDEITAGPDSGEWLIITLLNSGFKVSAGSSLVF